MEYIWLIIAVFIYLFIYTYLLYKIVQKNINDVHKKIIEVDITIKEITKAIDRNNTTIESYTNNISRRL